MKLQKHREDYERPLEVERLCRVCHPAVDAGEDRYADVDPLPPVRRRRAHDHWRGSST